MILMPPACPIGSACCGGYDGMDYGYGAGMCRRGCGYGGNWLGSVTQIPLDKIAGFTHNAI